MTMILSEDPVNIVPLTQGHVLQKMENLKINSLFLKKTHIDL